MVGDAFPTPYPYVNAVLDRLLVGVRAALEARFVGLYLHGSLAYGDFTPQTSDLDFLVVTGGPLPNEVFSALQAMHARLRAEGTSWTQKLEGAYIPQKALRRHAPDHPAVPWLGVDGHFARESLGPDWILQRWILREKGIVLAGPPLDALIDPLSGDDLRAAVRGSLGEWWSPPFPSPERFQSDAYRAYAVLTMCRSLYVLEHGRIASKPQAATWAVQTLGSPWAGLAAQAVAWEPGRTFAGQQDTFAFIEFTLKRTGP
ncbi:MAG: DUF4111 domain-containing protein [Anaerolineales bacterium]|nr:DUF4111 domain-containing protein [Anaerolineales bacterium]